MAKRIYLEDIVLKKRERVNSKNFNVEEIMDKIISSENKPSFYNAINKEGLSIIGEIKKASPSKGLIRENFKPLEIAREYQESVDAISILTEEDFFHGKEEYLEIISKAVKMPILCKDFIINPKQIYNAKLLGASCILLIVAILTDKELEEFLELSTKLGLDALVEAHTKEEIERAKVAGAKIIGINNRDLETFKTNISTTINLRQYIPEDIIVISESGIHSKEDIEKLNKVKIDGILVGESFMKTRSIKHLAEDFKNAYTR